MGVLTTYDSNVGISGKTHMYQFDSVHDAMEMVRPIAHHMEGFYKKHYGGMVSRAGEEFIGRPMLNIEDAIKATETVWDWGMKQYEKMMEFFNGIDLPKPERISRKCEWSEDDGEELDIDRLMGGQAYMRTSKRRHKPGPVNATIVTSLAAYSGMNSNNFLWRGIAAMVLTHLMEASGYRVEFLCVSAVQACYKNYENLVLVYNLKRCQDPIDVSTLINVLSGWFFRTVCLALEYEHANLGIMEGHGKPVHDVTGIAKRIVRDEKLIVCQDLFSESSAKTWVLEQLKKIN